MIELCEIIDDTVTTVTKFLKPHDDFTLEKLNKLYENIPTYDEFMEGIENGKLQSY